MKTTQPRQIKLNQANSDFALYVLTEWLFWKFTIVLKKEWPD